MDCMISRGSVSYYFLKKKECCGSFIHRELRGLTLLKSVGALLLNVKPIETSRGLSVKTGSKLKVKPRAFEFRFHTLLRSPCTFSHIQHDFYSLDNFP